MKIRIVIKNNPDARTMAECQEFVKNNWGKHEQSQAEIEADYFDQPKFVVQAVSKNQLMGLLYVFVRNITLENQSILMAGFGGMVTHAKHRGNGIATTILKEAMRLVIAEKIDIAMLCTDIPKLGGLYQRVGFVPLGKPYYFFNVNGVKRVENSGMIAAVGSHSKFKLVLETKTEVNVGKSNF